MENKGVSLNLVLKKKGSPDTFKSVSEPSENRSLLSLKTPEPSTPPDTSEKVPSRTLYQELAEATPPTAALEVYPDWRGLLSTQT